MTGSPDLRLGVVSYGTPDDLDACLQAVPAAVAGLDVEVVVVDNGSPTDSDADAAGRHPVRLLRNARNVGYPRAMNQALAGSRAPYLLALNPDTLAEPGSLTRLVEKLEADPGAGLVGPQLRGADGDVQHSVHAFPAPGVALATGLVPHRLRGGRLGRRYWLEGFGQPEQTAAVDWLVGAVHCIRQEALRRDKPYSERSFMYAEDMELCWHVRENGYRVLFEPSSTVVHVGNVTGDKSFGERREARWLDATYDWAVHARGRGPARLWAAANTVGLSAKLAVLARSGDPEHRRYVRELLALHARRVVDPAGDQHSRRAPDGSMPAEPQVVLDTGGPDPA